MTAEAQGLPTTVHKGLWFMLYTYHEPHQQAHSIKLILIVVIETV